MNQSVDAGLGGGHRLEGVGGVARPVAVDLDVRHDEAGVVGDRALEPGGAALGGRDGRIVLVRRPAGGHEAHLVEPELPERLAGHDEVADVRWIEGAPEHAHPPR